MLVKASFNQENQANLLGLLQPEDVGTPLEHKKLFNGRLVKHSRQLKSSSNQKLRTAVF